MLHKIKIKFMEVKTMKKSIKPKIKKIEAIYDSKIITETSEIFLNFLINLPLIFWDIIHKIWDVIFVTNKVGHFTLIYTKSQILESRI